MNHNHLPHGGTSSELILTLVFILVSIIYLLAAIRSSCNHRKWPLYRSVCWVLGVLCASAAIVGPVANDAHTNFPAHMLGHLLLGMLAPLLMALAAPMTLFLRSLPVNVARRLTHVLKTRPLRILSNPMVASLMNVGGLWILYTTDLYTAMQQNAWLHLFMHIHVFLAGFLFTVSIIYSDLVPHRFSFIYRALVLLIALAAHGILAKFIYAHPPGNILQSQAESAAMLMYYGGDAIDLMIIFIFCLQWYKATRPCPT
ncbi:cytochrome c oxidase assembly protein [Ammoniphilus sp. 3BR4]|uniref:cytochrome c oxidase assembly protein n=1 Tax=Ammoniphilus sp. 3BR4 TaxID=3158265 RepID=UPI003465104D